MTSLDKLNVKSIKNRVVLLDIDGTLTSDGDSKIEEGITQKVAELKANDNKIYLCSNKKDHYRNRGMAKFLGVSYLETDMRKPNWRIKKLITPKDKKRIVIGDKYLTDGRFAKAIGAEFVRVGRVRALKENVITKAIYRIDDLFNDLLGG